jgi:hypothetical protein
MKAGNVHLLAAALALLPLTCSCGDNSTWQANGDIVIDNFQRVSGTSEMSLERIRSRLWPSEPIERFRKPGLEQRRAFMELLEAMASRDLGESLEAAQSLEPKAHVAGFEVERWKVGDEHFVALIEPAGLARGSGAYVFRLSPRLGPATAPRRSVILQAPHSFHDEGTGRLATAMFFDQQVPKAERPWALFVNNAHRYLDENGRTKSKDYNPSDACHSTEHLFNDATEGMAGMGPLVVYQIHGFDSDRVKAEMIVSSGHPLGSTKASAAVADRLDTAYGAQSYTVIRFPEETKRFGATRNMQARILLAKEDNEFVHIEISAEARHAILKDPRLIGTLAKTLFTPLDPTLEADSDANPATPKDEAEPEAQVESSQAATAAQEEAER